MLPDMSTPTRSRIADAAFDAADAAFAAHLESLHSGRPLRHPALREARRALQADRPDQAERLLAVFLAKHPNDLDALNLMAEALLPLERKSEAEILLAGCVARASGFDLARFNYANALRQLNKPAAALEQFEILLAKEPRNPLYRDAQALALSAVGRHKEALACREALVRDLPGSAKLEVCYAQVLRTIGCREQAIAAFLRAIGFNPALGIAWWGLASLRDYGLMPSDIGELKAQLARPDISPDDRLHLLFALGKAFGDLEQYRESFDAYARANAARSLAARYDAASTSARMAKLVALCTPEFFAERAGYGADSAEPIFVVGMQRAGSTLVEQILASHPMIEGAGELGHIRFLARRLEDNLGTRCGAGYPDVLAALDHREFRSLGDEYLATTRARRPLGRPFFIDKEPFNFLHVGLLQLILPNCRIIDIRRHPLACCFSNFTSIFLHGLAHTYRLTDLGRFYADYVELMAHYDRVLPGRVYRIFYEDLVADPRRQVRQLLAFLDLRFDEACLSFHENARPINSASSEQVRSPIFHEGLDRWRHYEPWLDSLKTALGPVLTAYPAVPFFGQ
jgi:tetratricopeptide (TPR) repeat protein